MNPSAPKSLPSAAVKIRLLQDAVYAEDTDLWLTQLRYRSHIQDYFCEIGLELVIHEEDGFGYGYAIGWKERNFRRIGAQKVPSEVIFPSQDDYLRFLDKAAEVKQFELDCRLITQRCPELISWMQTKPLKVVTHAGAWDGLLSVSLHLKENPRPNCYLRELPVGWSPPRCFRRTQSRVRA
jgi:hypothetical protein